VVMTGAVNAAQSAAWLPFAADAAVTIALAGWLTRFLRREANIPSPQPSPRAREEGDPREAAGG